MDKTIEQKVGGTILQKTREVTVGGQVILMSPPSVATLILVSEAVSLMPRYELNSDKIVECSLAVAKDCHPIGDMIAIMLLGSKHLTEERKITRTVKHDVEKTYYKSFLWGLLKKPVTVVETVTEDVEEVVTVDRKAELASQLLEEYTPTELHRLAAELISEFQLGDFFGLTTFLTEVNMLRPTKVVKQTTASGQLSPE